MNVNIRGNMIISDKSAQKNLIFIYFCEFPLFSERGGVCGSTIWLCEYVFELARSSLCFSFGNGLGYTTTCIKLISRLVSLQSKSSQSQVFTVMELKPWREESSATPCKSYVETTPAVCCFFVVSFRIYWKLFSTLDSVCSMQRRTEVTREELNVFPRLYWLVQKEQDTIRCVK